MSFDDSTGSVYACVRCRVTVHVDACETVRGAVLQAERGRGGGEEEEEEEEEDDVAREREGQRSASAAEEER